MCPVPTRKGVSSRRSWIWLGVWLGSRALIVAGVVRWAGSHALLQDVSRYEQWAAFLTHHGEFPGGNGWQYPPGAGLLMLVPRLLSVDYGAAWVGLMLVVDFVGLLLVARLARRSGRQAGVWVWLLGPPLLGVMMVLRFDLVPSVIAIAALAVIHRRPAWFGALAGLGAAIKLWPALLLLGEWDRRRLARAALAAAAVVALVCVASTIAFGNPAGFISHGGGRGLQEESVGTIPWQVVRIASGDPYPREVRFGAWEIVGAGTGAVVLLLKAMALAALAGATVWWWQRGKAIREGRAELAEDSVSRDFVFAVVLRVVVTSPVLSPQYMVWLLGLAAVVLSGSTRLGRAAWIVVGATALSTKALRSPEVILLRDLALLFAATDAAATMARLLRPRRPSTAASVATST